MKVEGYLFSGLAVFLAVVSVIYGVLSGEVVGTTCLALSGGLALIVGYYILFTARRMDDRPEDRADAEISEGAGEVGFFAPHSWWPILLAASFAVTTLGLVFGPFVGIIGFFALMIAVSGLLFEYYVGVNRSQGFTLGELEAMGEAPTASRKFLGE